MNNRRHADLIAAASLSENPDNDERYDFTLPVEIDGQVVDLVVNMNVLRKKVSVEVGFPANYRSEFSDALSDNSEPLVEIRFSAYPIHRRVYPDTDSFLHAFYSARQKRLYNNLVTASEAKALRGVATKTLCFALSRAVEMGLLLPTSIMGVEASGNAPSGERSALADTIYVPLGFEKRKDIGDGDWYLHTSVGNILQQCHALLAT